MSIFWLKLSQSTLKGQVLGCFMPTCSYLTVLIKAKQARLNRSSIHSILLALDIEDGCRHSQLDSCHQDFPGIPMCCCGPNLILFLSKTIYPPSLPVATILELGPKPVLFAADARCDRRHTPFPLRIHNCS